jgi:hypothetical protein
MNKCRCRYRIEQGMTEKEAFRLCTCSKGCKYCYINNINCGGMV